MINYFLYENDILNIKIKNFFERNTEIINNKQFIEKFISIFKMTKMENILEIENNIYLELYLTFLSKIFLNIIIFKKINSEIQNIIILNIYSILNSITSINNNNINQLIYELLINLYNIIIYHELSTNAIDNENNRTLKKYLVYLKKI